MGINCNLTNKYKLLLSITACFLIVCATYSQTDLFSTASGAALQSSQITFLTRAKDLGSATTVASKNDSLTDFNVKILKQVYQPGFENALPLLCIENVKNVTLLIIITSSPQNARSRMAIRRNWGSFHRGNDVVLAFMVGIQYDPAIARSLAEETATYKDIITEKNVDSYRNLPLKTMAILEWVGIYCQNASYILKTDDDMFINVPRLLEFSSSLPKSGGYIYGRMAANWQPVRNKESKYYVSPQAFSGIVYPDFVTGPAYLMTSDVATTLYEAAFGLAFLPLEDVFFTGVAALNVNATLVSEPRFTNDKLPWNLDTCVIRKAFAYHDVPVAHQFMVWTNLMDEKIQC